MTLVSLRFLRPHVLTVCKTLWGMQLPAHKVLSSVHRGILVMSIMGSDVLIEYHILRPVQAEKCEPK